MRQSLLSPGGQEHMRRLMSVIRSGRVTLSPIIMHRFKPDDLKMARDRFRHQRDGGSEDCHHARSTVHRVCRIRHPRPLENPLRRHARERGSLTISPCGCTF